jgi:tRNA A-37 threonylcarbamoyl transferase component Bud32
MVCPSCQTPVDASQHFCPACGATLTPSAAVPDPMLGQTFGGKYKIIRLLGEGGMGAVYEGEQQLGKAKRKVAVKTLHAHLSLDPKIKARFEREVGTVAELEHPNTIQVYDFGSNEEGILYIVMEFLQGKSLANLLEKEGAMPADRVERIMQQICGSLEEAHGRGIVHRDLKPDNVVLVDRAGKKDFVKVLDFGIAQRSHETDRGEQKLTQQGTVLGTPPYMSPEQFAGRPIDARSDIYSLGVMAYEMLTGKLPFEAQTAWEWATQHMTQAPRPIESFPGGKQAPAGMRSAVMRALAKAPEDRFQTVADFMVAFSATATSRGQKTEMGAPLNVAEAFGGAAGMAGVADVRGRSPVGGGGGGPPLQGHTPVGGNVSFPTPATIPQPPPSAHRRVGGRAALLAVAGLIGIASIVAIFFAMRGTSGGGSSGIVLDQGGKSTPTMGPTELVAPANAAKNAGSPAVPGPAPATPGAAPGAGDDVPPLSGPSHAPPRPVGPRPPAGPPPPANSVAPPSPKPTVPTPPVAPPPVVPAPAQPAPMPPKYDGPECLTARRLRALGHPKEAENWAAACAAKGGTP